MIEQVMIYKPKRRTLFPERTIDMSFGPTKRCSKCKNENLNRATDFAFDITKKDGLAHWCRPCSNNYQRVIPKKYISHESWTRNRIKYCKERLAFWTNELNKAQKDGM